MASRPGGGAAARTGNPDHLAANVAAAALRLSPGEIARLEAIS